MCSQEFPNIHRKTPVLESFLNNTAGLQACNFIKKRLQPRPFPVTIEKILRTVFFTEHLWWLLLNMLMVVKQNSNFESETNTVRLFLSCYMSVIEAVNQNRCS